MSDRSRDLHSGARGLVCIFAQVPRVGQVKTGLAERYGHAFAAELALAMLTDTVRAVFAWDRADLALALDPSDCPAQERAELVSSLGEPLSPDPGVGDSGQRLECVLTPALTSRPWVIALGADAPGMPLEKLDEALALLEQPNGPDAVFGPARAGGYFLFGARRFERAMLEGVDWSRARALRDSERALAAAGLSSARINEWFDVDEPSDLDDLLTLLRLGAILAPATARVLSAFDPSLGLMVTGPRPRPAQPSASRSDLPRNTG